MSTHLCSILLLIDCKHTYVGDFQGVNTTSVLSGRDDPDQATLLFPHYVIQRSGYIYHWEGNFKQTGKVLFQVNHYKLSMPPLLA